MVSDFGNTTYPFQNHLWMSPNVYNSASPRLMNPKDLRVAMNVYFSCLTHTKQLSLVMFCDTIAEIGNLEVGRDANTNAGRTDKRYVDMEHLNT